MLTFDKMILHHLAVKSRPGPLELLGRFAFIPVSGEERGEYLILLDVGKIVSLPKPLVELCGQIHAGNLPSR